MTTLETGLVSPSDENFFCHHSKALNAFILLGDCNKSQFSRAVAHRIGEELEALKHHVSYHNAQLRWDYLRILPVVMRHDVLISEEAPVIIVACCQAYEKEGVLRH